MTYIRKSNKALPFLRGLTHSVHRCRLQHSSEDRDTMQKATLKTTQNFLYRSRDAKAVKDLFVNDFSNQELQF